MAWYNEPDFLKLRREWYGKLKDDGFEDIEQMVGPKGESGHLLLGVSSGDLRRRLFKTETEDYYRYARQHIHTMPQGLDRAVWMLHSEGVSAAKGVRVLEKVWGPIPTSRFHRIVKREREVMFDRIAREADGAAKAAIEAWEDDEYGE